MKKEDKLYIESYVYKLVSLCAESNYKIDKFGNIVFNDKRRVIDNINKVIKDSKKQGIEASEKDIREYLIKIYQERSENPEITREAIEIISILEGSKEDKDNVTDKINTNETEEEVR